MASRPGDVPCGGFSTSWRSLHHALLDLLAVDDAVLLRLVRRHLFDRDDAAAVTLKAVDQLRRDGLAAEDHVVGQEEHEGLVADQVTGREDGVADAADLALAHVSEVRHVRDRAAAVRRLR